MLDSPYTFSRLQSRYLRCFFRTHCNLWRLPCRLLASSLLQQSLVSAHAPGVLGTSGTQYIYFWRALEMRARLCAALQQTNGGADASALAVMVLVAGGAPPSALAADPPRGGGGPAHGTAGVALVVVVAPQQSSRAQALPTAADEMILVAVEVRAPPARPTTLDVGRTRSNCGCPHQRCRAKTAVA